MKKFMYLSVAALAFSVTTALSTTSVIAQEAEAPKPTGCDRPASEMTLEEYGNCQVSLFKTQGLWSGSDCIGDCAGAQNMTIVEPVTGSASGSAIVIREPVPQQQAMDNYGAASHVIETASTLPAAQLVHSASIEAEPRTAAVFFNLGRSTLQSASEAELHNSAQAMINNPNWKLNINGHASADGGHVSNMKLSSRRAAAVYLDLLERGVPAEQLEYRGYGSTQLLDPSRPNSSTNRRVELVLTFTSM
ncbi:MAG: OmpA family protein [Robiginitomaculum sp.]|nr:OmpA family protein [Robiginitomaculum sp.]